jgi:hypothetical protein
MAAIKRKRAIQQFPSTEGSERGRHDLSELTTRPASYHNSLSMPRWLSPYHFRWPTQQRICANQCDCGYLEIGMSPAATFIVGTSGCSMRVGRRCPLRRKACVPSLGHACRRAPESAWRRAAVGRLQQGRVGGSRSIPGLRRSSRHALAY